MYQKKTFGRAAAVAVGVPLLWYALGAFGIMVIKIPFPQKPIITLSIENNELVFLRASGARGNCTPPFCIHVSTWRRAHIKFELDDMDDWAFSKIQLVAEPTPKLDFGTQTGFTQDMIDDFYVKINNTKVHPNTDGIIDLGGLTQGDKFKLIDLNDFQQTYSYQIKACDTTTSNPIVCKETDPMIVNEG